MSKRDKKANKADYQRAMDRLEDAVKDLGEAAKDNFADRAAEVLEQTAAKLKNEVSPQSRAAREENYDESHSDPSSIRSESDEGTLGHWRGEGSERPFRDLDNGKLWGICAGIAPYLGLEPWVVRCLAITAFIFAPQIIVPAYIIGYFVLDPRSRRHSAGVDIGAGRGRRSTKRAKKRQARNERYAARNAAKAEARAAKAEARAAKRARRETRRAAPGKSVNETPAAESVLPARNLLRNVRGTLQEAELRLRRMEGHVTSGRYELQKELRRIDPT